MLTNEILYATLFIYPHGKANPEPSQCGQKCNTYRRIHTYLDKCGRSFTTVLLKYLNLHKNI